MLTAEQALDIVRDCIREITGYTGTIGLSQPLSFFGIKRGVTLQRFKLKLAKAVLLHDYKIAAVGLAFDQTTSVSSTCDLIKTKAVPRKLPPPAPGEGILGGGVRAEALGVGPGARAVKRTPAADIQNTGGEGTFVIKKPRKKAAPARKTSTRDISLFLESTPGADLEETAGEVINKTRINPAPAPKNAARDTTSLLDSIQDPAGVTSLYTPGSFSGLILEPSAPPPERLLECTPQLEIREQRIPNTLYRMGLLLDQKPASAGADVRPVSITIPLNLSEVSVDVWLDCSSHFTIGEVPDPPVLTVDAQTGISTELPFTLHVLQPRDSKPMYVSAFFKFEHRPCGRITRYLEMTSGGLKWKEFAPVVSTPGDATEGDVVLPHAGAPPSVALQPGSTAADIRVEILRTDDDDGKHFTLECDTPQTKWKGPWTLDPPAKELVDAGMQTFMASKGDARIGSLKGAGMDFWDALPAKLQPVILDALEKGAKSMSIISEEPYIPWELIVPYPKGHLEQARKPLGVELQLGRWITGDYKSPRQTIPLQSGYVVSPKTSGLTAAAAEVTFLTGQLTPVDEILPATYTGLNTGLAAPPRNVIHFICHGKKAVYQTLILETPDTINSSQVRSMTGFQSAFSAGPLAFLNACEVGGQVATLSGVGGFANSFIQLGASAVIAPLWSVQDKVALDVTQIFYPQALKGVPFGEIIRQIRAKAYDLAIDSYAAYCYYGDPLAIASN